MGVTYKIIEVPEWQWTEDYICFTAKYIIACPSDRRCQVGKGWLLFGKLRGEKIRFLGEKILRLSAPTHCIFGWMIARGREK